MKRTDNRIGIMILLTMLVFAFAGCGRSANVETVVPTEEIPVIIRRWVQTKTAEISAGEEAVLFQQACEDRGFLALINRKTGDRIPAEALEDEDFVNDGRYDIYESALFRLRNVVSPKNAQRLGRKTPCAVKADKCYDCDSPERICKALVVFYKRIGSMDTEVVLIDEDLGY